MRMVSEEVVELVRFGDGYQEGIWETFEGAFYEK